MKTSKAQLKAVERYNKANTITICLRLNKETDKDIIDYLKYDTGNKQGFIKYAIREVISKEI